MAPDACLPASLAHLCIMSDNKNRTDIARQNATTPADKSSAGDVAAFLQKAKTVKPGAAGKGRVILALDATMSRQPTWDMAASIQGDMFKSVSSIGSLSMQLTYFRGFGECRSSRWAKDGQSLALMMAKIDCRAGQTQIAKILKHAAKEHAVSPVSAVVYIGDAMEENADELGHLAGTLGMRKVPIFMFQEGSDPLATLTFKEIARLSGGGWFRFDQSSADVLRRLLSSIAMYATGGLKALEARGAKEDRLLIEQMKPKGGKRG